MKASPRTFALAAFAVLEAVAIGTLLVLWAFGVRFGTETKAAHEDTEPGVVRTPMSESLATSRSTLAPEEPANPGSRPESRRAAGLLYGAIRHQLGSPGPTGWLVLERDGRQVGKAAVDHASTYAFAGIEPGRYAISSFVPECLPVRREVDVATEAVRLDLELETPWLLQVALVDPEGKPLAAALGRPTTAITWRFTAIATRVPLQPEFGAASSREIRGGVGSFLPGNSFELVTKKPLPRTVIGQLQLPPGRPVFVTLLLRNVVIATREVAPGVPSVTFTLTKDDVLAKLGSVRLRLVDERTGSPLANVRVGLDEEGNGIGARATDADGRVVITGLWPGPLPLVVTHPTLQPPPFVVVVPVGGTLDLGEIRLLARDKIAVEAGAGAKTMARWLGPLPPGCRVQDLGVGANGATIPSGPYELVASDGLQRGTARIDSSSATAAPVRIRLAPAAVVDLRCAAGEDLLAGTLCDPAGVPVLTRLFTGTSQESLVLAPGEYRLELTDLHGHVARRRVALPVGPVRVNVP